MSDFVFSNSNTKCDNSSCKFIKGHSYPCSSVLGYEVSKCSNFPCCKSDGHCGDCLFYKDDSSSYRNNAMAQYTQPTMFNTQYQSLVNDHKTYSNFNNNNDQRKFIINYVTVNNYYGSSAPNRTGPSMRDLIDSSGIAPEFSNPSSHLAHYRR